MDQAVHCALVQTDMDSGNDVVDWSRDNDHDVGVHHLEQLYHRHHVVDDDHVIDDDPRDDDHGLGPKLDPVKSFLNLVSNHFVDWMVLADWTVQALAQTYLDCSL